MPVQVLKEHLSLTSLRDGKHLVRRWRDDPLAILPEVLRMPVGQVGIVPFDAERLKRYRDAGVVRTILMLPTATRDQTLKNLDAAAALTRAV